MATAVASVQIHTISTGTTGWIFHLWQYNCSTGITVASSRLHFPALVVQHSTTLVLDCSGYGGPALFLSGPGALCERSFFVSGPGARPALLVSRRSSPKTLFSKYRRSVCRVWRFLSVCRGPTISVSGPGALCALCVKAQRGDRRSLCRGPALFLSGSGALGQGVCGARIVSVSELGALQRSLCQGLGALCRRVCRARRSPVVSETGSLFL